jgi:hypothetical protein
MMHGQGYEGQGRRYSPGSHSPVSGHLGDAYSRHRRYVAALRANKRHGGCRGTREVGSHRGQGA